MEVEVIVEIPQGSRNKYEVDHETGRIRLDRMLFTSTRYPLDYGFIPDTLAEDSDPLDAMIMLEEPTFPGCQVTVRPIGVFWMSDEHGPDAKILTVPAHDPRYAGLQDLDDVPRTSPGKSGTSSTSTRNSNQERAPTSAAGRAARVPWRSSTPLSAAPAPWHPRTPAAETYCRRMPVRRHRVPLAAAPFASSPS